MADRSLTVTARKEVADRSLTVTARKEVADRSLTVTAREEMTDRSLTVTARKEVADRSVTVTARKEFTDPSLTVTARKEMTDRSLTVTARKEMTDCSLTVTARKEMTDRSLTVTARKRVVMSAGLVSFLLLLGPLRGANADLTRVLKGIEDHYNRAQTLDVNFTESYTLQGRKRSERGELFLHKPGRMRWQYTTPAGKLYVSDGKFIYSYSPEENRAEKMKLKESDDMRAPLAFLLGRLNFEDDFREFRTQPDRDQLFITAIPKSDKMPYTEVTFLVSPDFVIHWLRVKGQDGSALEFVFENEKKNPPLPDGMFQFTPPPGVEYVDSSQSQ
jgi:outer membrane lipoprotein carrier protein